MFALFVQTHLTNLGSFNRVAVRVLDSAADGEASAQGKDGLICFRAVDSDRGSQLRIVWMSYHQGDLLEIFRDHVAGPASFSVCVRAGIGAELDIFLQATIASWTVELNPCAGNSLPGFVHDHAADRDAPFQFHRVT